MRRRWDPPEYPSVDLHDETPLAAAVGDVPGCRARLSALPGPARDATASVAPVVAQAWSELCRLLALPRAGSLRLMDAIRPRGTDGRPLPRASDDQATGARAIRAIHAGHRGLKTEDRPTPVCQSLSSSVKRLSEGTCSVSTFSAATMGTATMAPATPHRNHQSITATRITAGLSFKRFP